MDISSYILAWEIFYVLVEVLIESLRNL